MNAISFCSIKLVLIILLACPFQKGEKVQKINFRLIKFYILLMMNDKDKTRQTARWLVMHDYSMFLWSHREFIAYTQIQWQLMKLTASKKYIRR